MSCARYLAARFLLLGMFLPGSVAKAQQKQGEPTPPADQANEAAPSKPKRVRVSQGVAAKLVRKTVAPIYPQKARNEHIQGTVVLQARITPDGNVAELSVISGDPQLTEAAINAVKQWKYKAFLLQGETVEVETTIQINFTLPGG